MEGSFRHPWKCTSQWIATRNGITNFSYGICREILILGHPPFRSTISASYRENIKSISWKSWDVLIITFCFWDSQQYNDSQTRGKIASTKSSSIPLALYIWPIFSFTLPLSHHGLDLWECWTVTSAYMSHKTMYQQMNIQRLKKKQKELQMFESKRYLNWLEEITMK